MKAFLAMAALSIASAAAAADSCPVDAGPGCDFYDCRESVQDCGEQGYFLRFAYPYCEYFVQNLAEFSPDEQLWLGRVRLCLEESVDRIPPATACARTEDLAIASHVDCYVQTGFCGLPFEFKLRLLEIFRSELRDPRMLEDFLQLLARCQ